MGLRQRFYRYIFRWAQANLEPPSFERTKHVTIGLFDHVPFDELVDTCRILDNYQSIEISTIIHNIDEENEYSCVLLVGREKSQ